MSLWWRGRAIRRAVAGELNGPAERRLRAHLTGCPRCRARYDQLSLLVGPALAGRRERLRLEGLLPPSPPRARATQARLAMGFSVLVLSAGAFLLWPRSAQVPPAEVVYRGGGAADADESEPPFTLLLYASRKGSSTAGRPAVRLLGELPASGEVVASLGDYLQIGYRGTTRPGYLAVVGRDAAGGVVRYLPSTLLARSPDAARPVGPAIDLATRHRPGPVRLVALVAPEPIDVDRLEAIVGSWTRDTPPGARTGLPGVEVGGILHLDP